MSGKGNNSKGASSSASAATNADGTEKKNLPTYTLAQVKKHNTEQDLWMAINGGVYNVTDFLDNHPGGASNLTDHAGSDATSEFMQIHGQAAKRQLQEFLIGYLPENEGERVSSSDSGSGNALGYLVPILVLAIGIWYQFLDGDKMIQGLLGKN